MKLPDRPQPNLDTVQEMHATYLAVTGTEPRICVLSLDRMRLWQYVLERGHGTRELKQVLLYIMGQRKARGWSYSVLSLNRLIASVDGFEDWLQQAQAHEKERAAKLVPAKKRVLQEFRGRPEPEKDVVAKQVGDVDWQSELNKWRREHGIPERK